ncbi:MAG TPA: GNAT family N-acetyltransferase [Acidimicrobiales bacterium]|nr:GNAT family N-acetyltransferase [Acidimicrobiales bacterium]
MAPSPADEPVRRAGAADVDAIAALLARGGADAAPTRAAEVVGGAETWVVGFDQVRGVVALRGDRIVELSVDPPLRGQGIGMRLVALAQLRRPAGVAVVPPDGARVSSFFRRAGFSPAGDGDLLHWHP